MSEQEQAPVVESGPRVVVGRIEVMRFDLAGNLIGVEVIEPENDDGDD